MKKSIVLVSTMLLLLIGSAYAAGVKGPNSNVQAMGTAIIVQPSSVSMPIGSNFNVSVIVSNVTNLYGIDIQFTWDPTVIRYVHHVKTSPVETYPGGILHSSTINVMDNVDEAANMTGADPGTRYWLAEACLAPAEAFDGTGTAFNMTFNVIEEGSSPLSIVSATLADRNGDPIVYEKIDGVFSNLPPPQLASIYVTPSTNSVQQTKNFTVSVVVANVSDLYGFDIQFTWDPTVIKYVSHVKTIPVETYPGGILHASTINVEDQVDENDNMTGAEPGTRYWLAEACLAPAPSFNGTGIAFNMTFVGLAVGESDLTIVAATLADRNADPINYTTMNGHVNVTVIPEFSVTGFVLFAMLTIATASAIMFRKTRFNKRII